MARILLFNETVIKPGESVGAILKFEKPIKLDNLKIKDHLGWHTQGDGKWYIGIFIPSGRIKDDKNIKIKSGLRDIIKKFKPSVTLSTDQNIILGDINKKDRNVIDRLLKQYSIADQIKDMISNAHMLGDFRLVIQIIESPGDLKDLGDQFRNVFISKGVSLIGTIQKNKPMVMCAVTDDLTKKINAGNIVKEVGEIMGGGGGGNI